MANCDVAIGTHDGEEDGARELVDAGRRHVGLAHDVAKRPRLPAHGGDQEGDADQEAFVSHGQIHDV